MGCNRITGGCRPNWDPTGGLWFEGVTSLLGVWKNPCYLLPSGVLENGMGF
jgi:hypothetical protein